MLMKHMSSQHTEKSAKYVNKISKLDILSHVSQEQHVEEEDNVNVKVSKSVEKK